jgi:C-terminal processing protease CtpA/Prc
MVAGVGPVLGEATLGYFIGPTGGLSNWEYRDGASWLNGGTVVRLPATYRLVRENPRVAVLTDNNVASSGEAVAVAFRKRPDTRTFGEATCGLSTANQPYTMPDGAILNLTTAVMADRTRESYGSSLPPDEVITDQSQLAQRAVTWILTGK